MFVLSRVSLGIAGAEQLDQVARMITGNRERVFLDSLSNIQWVRSSGYFRRISELGMRFFCLVLRALGCRVFRVLQVRASAKQE